MAGGSGYYLGMRHRTVSEGALELAGTGGASTLEPSPGQYGTRAQLPLANSEMGVAELAGKIYVVGGYPSSRVPQAALQQCDSDLGRFRRPFTA